MARDLETYRSKRHFDETPEPSGDGQPGDATAARVNRRRFRRSQGGGRFVVQEHHATSMHWDLRLEREGVLMSWAVPRGLPPDPKRNHLAVQTEDHPLDYLGFEGEIPAGQYGAGTMHIWDAGTYECETFEDDKVVMTLHGDRVEGRYALVRTEGDQWLIHRMSPPSDPAREPMPAHVEPMLARLAKLPPDDEHYAFEIKWDGIRAMVYGSGGRLRIESRNLLEITPQYPEFAALGRALGSREVVLDAEIVALDENGLPGFQRLQQRMGLRSPSTIRRRAASTPATLMIFDILYLDGRVLMDLPYTERREVLESLELAGPHWQTPSYHVGDGAGLLAVTRERGIEGVIAKRLDSAYCPGRRSNRWLKVKNQQRQEFVVGGWTEGEGGRAGRIGALLVGYYDATPEEAAERGEPQRLVYAGSVGTGFTDKGLRELTRLLQPLATHESPFDVRSPGATKPIGKWQAMSRGKGRRLDPQRIHYVEPRHVAEIEYTEFTRDGTLRHPSFKGLRYDKPAGEVIREEPR